VPAEFWKVFTSCRNADSPSRSREFWAYPGALVRPIVSPMQLPSTALSVFSTGSSGASDHQAFKLQHGFSFGDVLNKGNFSRQAIKCRDV
jgi:hypothetical protein